jgi:hypothetical protein
METLVVLADVDEWRPLRNGHIEVRGKLDTLNKLAQPALFKVANWLRNATRDLLGQCNVENDLGRVRIDGKTIVATVSDPRALPLVKRGVFQKFVAIVDDVMGGEVLAISLVDRAGVVNKSFGKNSVLLYKRAAQTETREQFAERVALGSGSLPPGALLYDRDEAARINAERDAYMRQYYGVKDTKPPKDKASKAEVKRVRKTYRKLGGTLGKRIKTPTLTKHSKAATAQVTK